MSINPSRIAACLVIAMIVMGENQDRIAAQQLDTDNFEQLVPAGKEVDAIYGDFALSNPAARAIVAFPSTTRNANMTVRNVGGCLIDFAATGFESDQLSAFYPGRQKFGFSQWSLDDHSLTVISPGNAQKPKCEVRYEFKSDQPVIDVTSTWTNTTDKDWTVPLEDSLRADGGKEDMVKIPNGVHRHFYFADIYWQQAYAIRADGYQLRCNSGGRECVVKYEPVDGKAPVIGPGDSFSFTRQMIVARDLVSALAVSDQIADATEFLPCTVKIVDGVGRPIRDARIEFRIGTEYRGTMITDLNGETQPKLPAGEVSIKASVAGTRLFENKSIKQQVNTDNRNISLVAESYQPGRVTASITDAEGRRIPAKVSFQGHAKTPTPNWGPETAEHYVRNVAYTENGEFNIALHQGEYNVIVSRGPEYDAVFTRIKVEPGKTVELNATLNQSVQTPGWVSSDFHSHSSPSGDNTGSQRGRVLNLAAEHVEFAPCTEHNRISSYSGHISELGLKPYLATVSGMELTGNPLPLNHQNVFPLKHYPRTQDGGGPVTDANPETQMERVTLWDDRSEKLVQQNHPDLGWLFYDKNGDGVSDEGYWRSFPLMDVVEIHPIDKILSLDRFTKNNGTPNGNHRMLNWLQLLNQGKRIYGVVNTDAHYNYHGSGWLRNWIQSTTDDPAKIDPIEMVRASEQGRLVMSNGPFLEATFNSADAEKPVVSGQDLVASDGKVKIQVRVQCPNWFDIDTVFLLINGELVEEFQFSRTDNPEMFGDGVVKFDQTLDVSIDEDSHIVVVTGHRAAKLGDVMGPSGGNQHPAALTNPVFVDVDGNGFKPNGDTLGFPLPVKFGTEKRD